MGAFPCSFWLGRSSWAYGSSVSVVVSTRFRVTGSKRTVRPSGTLIEAPSERPTCEGVASDTFADRTGTAILDRISWKRAGKMTRNLFSRYLSAWQHDAVEGGSTYRTGKKMARKITTQTEYARQNRPQ